MAKFIEVNTYTVIYKNLDAYFEYKGVKTICIDNIFYMYKFEDGLYKDNYYMVDLGLNSALISLIIDKKSFEKIIAQENK